MATPEIIYLNSYVSTNSVQISTINNKSTAETQLYRQIVDLSVYNPQIVTTSIIGLEPI